MDLRGKEEDIAYSSTFIERLLRIPSKKDAGTVGSQPKLTVNFTCSSIHKLNLEVYRFSVRFHHKATH